MSTLTTSVDPNASANAIVDKKIARGEIDATSTESSSSSSSSSSEPAPIIKPDVPGFLKQFIVSDVIVNILIAITLFGSIGVYLSHVAHSNCMPGLEINVSTAAQSSIMNLFRKWGWSFQPEQTYGQTATFDPFNSDNALHRLFASNDSTGIQPYLYAILKYLSEVNNLCTNTIFGGMYHLPQWLTMLIFIPVALMVFLFLLLVNSIFHIVGIVKFLTTTLFDVDKETLSETIGHACYALFHLFVLTWIIPWITTFASFVEPMRTTFKWECNNTTNSHTKPKKFQDFFNVFIRVMQPFILILISLSMVSNANTYLGDGYTGASIFAILFFVYRGWYHVDISTFPEANTFFKL